MIRLLSILAIAAAGQGCTYTRISNPQQGWTVVRVTTFFDQTVKQVAITAKAGEKSNTTNSVWHGVMSGYSSEAGRNIEAAATGAGLILKAAAGIP